MIDSFVCTTDHETETLTFCIIEMIIESWKIQILLPSLFFSLNSFSLSILPAMCMLLG